MTECILKVNGNVIIRRTMQTLNIAETQIPDEIKKRYIFGEIIESIWGTDLITERVHKESSKGSWNEYEENEESFHEAL